MNKTIQQKEIKINIIICILAAIGAIWAFNEFIKEYEISLIWLLPFYILLFWPAIRNILDYFELSH